MTDQMTALVVALDDEVRGILSKLEVDSRIHLRPALFTRGKYGNKPLLIVRSGIGIPAMEAAAAYLFEHDAPRFCLHVGYCGGTEPKDQAGDLIIANAVVDSRTGERFEPDAESITRAEKIVEAHKLRARTAALATVEKVVGQPHEKAFLGTHHGVAGVDMESAALARACCRAGVRYLIVRAVLDPMDALLPDMEGVIAKDGTTDGVKLAEHLMRKPKDVWHLPRMHYFASQARLAITAFVEAWLEKGER